jgi:hypothetical protein
MIAMLTYVGDYTERRAERVERLRDDDAVLHGVAHFGWRVILHELRP